MVIFIAWIAFIILQQKTKLQFHKRACENKDFCKIIMPSEDTKNVESSQYQKSDKTPFIIYVDLECIIEKVDGCKNNLEKLSTTKGKEHNSSGFSMSTISFFRGIKN